MILAGQQAGLLADTSPFCRFAENACCDQFADYLAHNLRLTASVVAELEHRANQPAHAMLRALANREPPWTPQPIVQLTDQEMKRANDLAQGWARLQEKATRKARDPRANLGEATTIVAALREGLLVILDEGRAKGYSVKKGLTVITTQDVVVEMTAMEVLKRKPGFLLYQRVYSTATQAGFDAALEAMRKAIAA